MNRRVLCTKNLQVGHLWGGPSGLLPGFRPAFPGISDCLSNRPGNFVMSLSSIEDLPQAHRPVIVRLLLSLSLDLHCRQSKLKVARSHENQKQ